MFAVTALGRVLAWLGRQRGRGVAAVLLITVLAPVIDRPFKPFVGETIFVMLCIAFARADFTVLRMHLRRPGLVLAATVWMSVVVPALLGASLMAAGVDKRAPDFFLSVMLQIMAPPIMSSPAFAELMGLDATFVLTTLVAGMALTPFSAPAFAYVFVNHSLTLSPQALGLKLSAILAGSAAVGLTIRYLIGPAPIRKYAEQLNGVNILLVFVFGAAIMEGVAGEFIASPLTIAGLVVFAFVLFFVLLTVTAAIFVKAGRRQALALGLMAAQRNMGLMVAATGSALPDFAWLFIAVAQFPIYLSPFLLNGLVRRLTADGDK